jgi:hypothetical protein
MACPQILDGEDSIHIWKVTPNILIKQVQTANNGCPSSLEVRLRANTSLPQKAACYEILQRDSEDRDQWRVLVNVLMNLWVP